MAEYEREVQRLSEELVDKNEKSIQLEKQCESDLRNMEKTK